MKRGPAKQQRSERGTQVAELAMVLPLLLFLGLAVTEGAGFVRAHQVINNAAREGARFASSDESFKNETAVIQGVVDTYLKTSTSGYICQSATGCNDSTPLAVVTVDTCTTVTTPAGINKHASQVSVSYAYQLQYLPRLPWFSFPSTVNLQGRATFIDLYGC
jgi:Flp pilus assembly protein TadG